MNTTVLRASEHPAHGDGQDLRVNDVAFPHVCAGERCAVCAWIELRAFRLGLKFPYGSRGESGILGVKVGAAGVGSARGS